MVVCLDQAGVKRGMVVVVAVGVVVLLRFVALHFGWQTPVATDLPGTGGQHGPHATDAIEYERPPARLALSRPIPGIGRRWGGDEDPRDS